MDDIPLKRCPTCPDPEENHWHPATNEFWHNDKRTKDGLTSRCKICACRISRENYAIRQEEAYKKNREYYLAHHFIVECPQKHYVYTLSYPEDYSNDQKAGTIFYVGKGTEDRIHQHEQEARRADKSHRSHKENVIHQIWREGKEIIKAIPAYFDTHEEAIQYEIALIFLLPKLTNLTSGGEGVPGLIVTPEHRMKVSTKLTGRKHSKEHNRRIGEAHQGLKRSERAKQNMALGCKKRTYKPKSPEHRAKIGKAHKGRPRTAKQIEVTIAHSVKTYSGFIAPNGRIYRNITNLAAFCREHGLDDGHMIKVFKGMYQQHKGWRKLGDEEACI